MTSKNFICFFLFCLTACSICGQANNEFITLDTLDISLNGTLVNIKKGNYLLAYGLIDSKHQKNGEWKFYFPNGTVRITCTFNKDIVSGKCLHYYDSGQLKSDLRYEKGVPSGLWKSYYPNADLQGEILWNDQQLPSQIRLYFQNDRLAINKLYDYSTNEVELFVKSYYQNGSPFEEYTTYQHTDSLKQLITDSGIGSLVHASPHLGIHSNDQGKLSGFYKRYFNSGKEWIFLEFDNDLLIEVLANNSPDNGSLNFPFNDGNGKVVHFHHYKDTAAIINYQGGHKHGPIKLFHEGNNTHRTGAYIRGIPTGSWISKSYSGKIKNQVNFNEDGSLQWTLYGPKNQKSKIYSLRNNLLNGVAISYDFYGDTTAVFSYTNGILNGRYTSYINKNVLRYGDYDFGEQIGNWYTKGQFNDISHTTTFGKKDVLFSLEHLPMINFRLKGEIDLPLKIKSTTTEPYSISNLYSLYNASTYIQFLLTTPDSDDIWGTSHYKALISDTGFLKELNLIKSPSTIDHLTASRLIRSNALFIPFYTYGFPSISDSYLILEHYKE